MPAHLFVIEAGGEGENTGAGVEGEHVVGPVGDEGVAQLAIGPRAVGVLGQYLADPAAPCLVLRHVEGVGLRLELRRVVVRVGDLYNREEERFVNYYDFFEEFFVELTKFE